mgnify:CR=1 FL=1
MIHTIKDVQGRTWAPERRSWEEQPLGECELAIVIQQLAINPNTIDLTPDGRWLFVSTRGPNNPESYLLRSLKPGRLEVFDLATKARVISMEGGTQPTGLDVSPDGALVAFTNFQDDAVELYRIVDE